MAAKLEKGTALEQPIRLCYFVCWLLFSSVFPAIALANTENDMLFGIFSNNSQAPIDSELATLPASIVRYNANMHRPDATPTNDYSGYGSSLCQLPAFKCVRVKSGQTWASLWPEKRQREMVMRLNRTNVALRYRRWLVIPKHLKKVDYMSLSPLPVHVDAGGHRLLIVDLRVFAFGAYDANGNIIYWGPASGGKTYCQDTQEDCRTVVGNYHVYRIRGKDCQSSKYPVDHNGGAPMPYCMYYYKGYAIHGSTLSGFVNGSRGCVRLFYSDAKWLNQNFVKPGTEVIVKR